MAIQSDGFLLTFRLYLICLGLSSQTSDHLSAAAFCVPVALGYITYKRYGSTVVPRAQPLIP